MVGAPLGSRHPKTKLLEVSLLTDKADVVEGHHPPNGRCFLAQAPFP